MHLVMYKQNSNEMHGLILSDSSFLLQSIVVWNIGSHSYVIVELWVNRLSVGADTVGVIIINYVMFNIVDYYHGM